MRTILFALALALIPTATPAALPTGYTKEIRVAEPTRLDWVFASTNRSPAQPPADLLGADYDSSKQSYELFLPTRKNAKSPSPAVVFVSAGDDPAGWKAFEPVCKELGVVFIGVRGAGNNVPTPRRCRVILDCLDDVRRQVPLDPDRTYIAGFSGGGRVACAIAFALPEQFGGVLSFGAGGELRGEPWLRHRAADRLSVALVTGNGDFNRGEVEKYVGPYWAGIGIRAKVWVRPKHGHALPPSDAVTEAVRWLEAGKGDRAAFAKKYPASRAPAEVPTREQAAMGLLKEGEQRLAAKPTLQRGLMLVKGVLERWPDTEAGMAARKRLEAFEEKGDRSWEVDDVAELRRDLTARARALSDYAINGIPPGSNYEKQRPDMARAAIGWWGELIADAPDSELAKEGKKRVAELRALEKK